MATASSEFKPIQSFEPLTKAQLNMLAKSLGPIQAMIMNLGQVDLTKGAGVISKQEKCVWTKDGKRITFSLSFGTFIGSCSKDADPNCPGVKKEGE